MTAGLMGTIRSSAFYFIVNSCAEILKYAKITHLYACKAKRGDLWVSKNPVSFTYLEVRGQGTTEDLPLAEFSPKFGSSNGFIRSSGFM